MHPANEDSMKAATDWAASFMETCRRLRQQSEPAPTPGAVVRQIRQQLAAKPRRWRGCLQRGCRRHHRCASPDLWCILTALSPEQQAETRAQLARALSPPHPEEQPKAASRRMGNISGLQIPGLPGDRHY